MIPALSTRRLLPLLLCAAVAGLSSCKLVRKNYDVISDRVSPARSDDVMVESSGALPTVAPASAVGTAPTAPTAPAASASGKVVTVQKGDTLSGLARKHGTTVAAICAANSTTPTTPIRVGQKLHLPSGSSAAPAHTAAPRTAAANSSAKKAAARTYKVKRGDSISRIAAKHGVKKAALLRANNMSPAQADHIREGQTLRIPAK